VPPVVPDHATEHVGDVPHGAMVVACPTPIVSMEGAEAASSSGGRPTPTDGGEVTFHDLRGFSATMAARHGATTRELMRRLRHATPEMALRYQRAEAERDTMIARAMSSGL
jgi:integrase